MIEIIEAIATRVGETPALTQGLTGGFHLDHPPQGTVMPFAVLVPISAPPQYNTSATYIQPVRLQLSIFTRKLGDVTTLIRSWRDAFNQKGWNDLAPSRGKVMSAVLVDERVIDDPTDETDAHHAKHYILEFEFTQLQAHA